MSIKTVTDKLDKTNNILTWLHRLMIIFGIVTIISFFVWFSNFQPNSSTPSQKMIMATAGNITLNSLVIFAIISLATIVFAIRKQMLKEELTYQQMVTRKRGKSKNYLPEQTKSKVSPETIIAIILFVIITGFILFVVLL